FGWRLAKRLSVTLGCRLAPPPALGPRGRLDHLGRRRGLFASALAFGRLRGRLGGLRFPGRTRGRAPLPRPPPAPPARRARLRRGEVVGECTGDLLDRAEPLACVLEQLVRPRCVALGAREQRGADRERHLERGLDELRGIVLVAVAA